MKHQIFICFLLLFVVAMVPNGFATIQKYERKEFFETGEHYEFINATNNPVGGRQFSFIDNALVVNVTEANFILVRPVDDTDSPFFELCGRFDPVSCRTDKAFICYSTDVPIADSFDFCYQENLQTIKIYDNRLVFGAEFYPLDQHEGGCRKFYQKSYTQGGWTTHYLATSKDEPYEGDVSKKFSQIKFEPLPNHDKFIQIRMRVVQTYCGLPVRFPNSSIAVYAPPPITTPTPPSTTTPKKITKHEPVPVGKKTTSKAATSNPEEETKESSSPLPLIGIIFGSLAFVLLVAVIVGFIIRYVLKRRKRKTTTHPLLKDPRSLSSISIPPPPPLEPEPIPFMDPALEDKTQELSIVVSKTQEPAKSNAANVAKNVVTSRDPLKTISKTKSTTVTKTLNSNMEKKEGSGSAKVDGAAGAAGAGRGGSKEDKKESESSEIPLPALTIDTTKKFTKLYKEEFERGDEDSMASEENCGENVFKIDAFCHATIPILDQAMANWPPDYVEQMACRAPDIEHRGIFHYQALIMANNLLLKKGVKNNKGTLAGSTKGLKWLKTRQNIPFVQFISECIENAPDGSGSEFLASKIQWRRCLKKLDVVETFRQSCWLGQTKERREFFLLATFFKMELLCKQFPREDDLKTFPFPVPMLLEVRKEAPRFFEISEGKVPTVEKKGSADAAGGGGAPVQTPQIPKFSN